MKFKEQRELVVKYCNKMISTGLTRGTGGNISIFVRDENLVVISPSGIDYETMTAEDVVVIDLDGNVVDGTNRPSSEYHLHTVFYKQRDDIDSVVHAHPIYASTLSVLGMEIPSAYYLNAVCGGPNVRCAKYALNGTEELAENVFEAMRDRFVVLMANHGLVAGAKDVANAFNKAEEIELSAEVYYKAKLLGEPNIISDEGVQEMLVAFKKYSQVTVK
ncbi:5-deoxy-D-ribulose 1-phosphate aldolase [Vibrio stylophorae]|uniref:5-deoxy-D-ribulose 1-phosphate aldolase n=1 Tax=Vibrio stylophorae TaxID=659351 RepID=A0ABM8ZR46_9VIBR|nr:L-fuculose-phosphate aldolase [Vibrio stylophorae]CAH0532766.1 5-deoxy-D-ribulose 1-phosphate aldolase [Vibrio stylophorae]